MSSKKNIVIIGAGYAGILTAQGLSKGLDPNEWSIQLVSDRAFHVHWLSNVIDWAEQKQVAKVPGQVGIVVPNILAAIKNQPPPKVYSGGMEGILLPAGPKAGIAYLPFLWGLILGDWFSTMVKSKTLFVQIAQKATRYV
ncbi:hypothetical protein FRB90_003596 [Tulasnella sp. 427]|nr:hypothetical protein FRB90_003596 [Tulasnella sp. 427]